MDFKSGEPDVSPPDYYLPVPDIPRPQTLDGNSYRTRPDPSSATNSVISPFADPQDTKAHKESSTGYVYSYVLWANFAELEFLVSVQPASGPPRYYDFSLALKVYGVERNIGESMSLKLAVDPSELDFAIFVFPPKASLPKGCLHFLRVWLRVNGVDHRLFAEDELWIGKDPDFNSVENASFAHHISQSPNLQIYQGLVGKAHVNFLVRWEFLHENVYKLCLEYEAGGAGRVLSDDIQLRLGCDPARITFVIYTLPVTSTPEGASHRLRIWICSPTSSPRFSLDGTRSYVCQRIWKSDTFKIGALLDFEALGDAMIMASPRQGVRNPQAIAT